VNLENVGGSDRNKMIGVETIAFEQGVSPGSWGEGSAGAYVFLGELLARIRFFCIGIRTLEAVLFYT
jgi:hypothetical protein